MFDMSDPQHLMNESEFKRFLSLPNEVKIYRGGAGVSATKLKYGMCWTTEIDQAAWFANRFLFRGQPLVIEAFVKNENIFGYFDYEDEVIIKGGEVSKMKISEIDISKASQNHIARIRREEQVDLKTFA